jgi:hypothetical protein
MSRGYECTYWNLHDGLSQLAALTREAYVLNYDGRGSPSNSLTLSTAPLTFEVERKGPVYYFRLQDAHTHFPS